ncbi:MAG TPA: hypothetical protein VFU35_09805 [Jatrophihabitans sp.]|nr:hypothetical protein [Jatrophihabitans sp.]
MVLTQPDLARAVVRYAERFHAAVGQAHHVGSPLGAWLVLALAGPAARGDQAMELADVLGVDVAAAAARADALLSHPHPLVSAAAAVWYREEFRTPDVSEWLGRLPGPVETGPIPDQAALDAWASRHTDGLIDRFPITVSPSVVLLLASALATRVSWEVPFETVPASELGATSTWAARLTQVLRTPADPRHEQFVASTERCGDVAVHAARARSGLLVASVIAAPDVPAGHVLTAAHHIAVALADRQRLGARSLFELPLGDGPLWTITERPAPTTAADGRAERYSTCLPAWSAHSEFDLTDPTLGFGTAAAALARLLHLSEYGFEAKQAAMARYTRVGFEAAAVTGLPVAVAMHVYKDGVRRDAHIRFDHPYAGVAVATDDHPRGETRSPWHGLPVFSAWITEPEDA